MFTCVKHYNDLVLKQNITNHICYGQAVILF